MYVVQQWDRWYFFVKNVGFRYALPNLPSRLDNILVGRAHPTKLKKKTEFLSYLLGLL